MRRERNPLNHPTVVLGIEAKDSIPPAVRKRLRTVTVLTWTMLVLFGLVNVLLWPKLIAFTPWLWCMTAMIFVLVFWGSRVANRRVVFELREFELAVCDKCGYCLRGLPESHTCPDCGHEYDLADLRDTWQDWIDRTGHRQTPPHEQPDRKGPKREKAK